LSLWAFLDACSPAAAFGYGIGRIGCLLSGDGDYGIPTSLPWGVSFPKGLVPTTGIWDPESHSGVCFKYGLPANCTVHPTPLYELIVSCAIGWLLWRLGARLLKNPERAGEIFGYYLLLSGVARFLVEIIRINPPWILGMSNAQVASLLSILFGAVLLWRIKSQFHARKKERRIVEHIDASGHESRPEYHKNTPECPHPGALAYAARVWCDILRSLSTPIAEPMDRQDGRYLLAVFLSFAAGLATSWQRWGNPLVDSGRELNVPLRLAHGEMLYSDVGYLYGPLSPYLNALLYRFFHPSLWVVWGRGIVSTIVLLTLIYWLARQLMHRFPAMLACFAVTWVCALKSQGNYMLAYAFPGLDGAICLLATAICLILFLRKESFRWLLAAGSFASLAILAKTEMGGAALITGLAAVFLAGYSRPRTTAVWATVFVASATIVPAFVFAAFASRVGWRTLTVENHIFFGHVPWQLLYFNSLRFGFGRPFYSLALMLLSLGRLIALGGLLASLSLLLALKSTTSPKQGLRYNRSTPRIFGMLSLSIAGILLTGFGLSDLGPFMAMPFILVVLAFSAFVAFAKAARQRASSARVHAATVLLLACLALASLARIILRVSTGGALSSFLLPASVVLFFYVWIVLFPSFLPDPETRWRAARLVSVVLFASVIATAVTLSIRYRRKLSYPLVTPRGTWFTTPDLGIGFEQALNLIALRTAPDDFVSVMPEGTSLNFLSGRRNPLHDEIVTPGFLDAAGEEHAIERLRDSHTALILIANRPTSEFFETSFGIDYDRQLMQWIQQNYDVCGLFGPHPDANLQVGSRTFFIRAYCSRYQSQRKVTASGHIKMLSTGAVLTHGSNPNSSEENGSTATQHKRGNRNN